MEIGDFDKGWSVSANFNVVGDVFSYQFVRIDRPVDALQLCRSVHTKKLCSRLSSSEVQFYTVNGRFAF